MPTLEQKKALEPNLDSILLMKRRKRLLLQRQIETDWDANLRKLIKNTEKDADFLRQESSRKVRGARSKTQVTIRLQEGLGENNSRSSCIMDIERKKETKAGRI